MADIKEIIQHDKGLIQLNLPGLDTVYLAYPTSIEKQLNGNISWSGKFIDGEGDLFFIHEDGRTFGHIRVDDKAYDLQSFDTSTNFLTAFTYDSTNVPGCGNVIPNPPNGDDPPVFDLPPDWTPPQLGEESEDFCEDQAIRVLFLFTTAGEAQVTDKYQTARIATQNMNIALGNSRATGVKVELAGVENISFVESSMRYDCTDSAGAYYNADPAVKTLRDTKEADIVILLGDYENSFALEPYGIVAEIGPIEELAYGIVRANLATTLVTCHEIGHLLGCRHQKTNDPVGPIEHAHKLIGTDFLVFGTRKTVMWSDPLRKTIPYFSNPKVRYSGIKTGKDDQNNTLKMQQTVNMVKSFRPNTQNIGVLITDKPDCLLAGDSITLNMVTCGGLDVIAYQWGISTDGINYTTPIMGSGASSFTTVMPANTLNLYVRLVVTFSDGRQATAFATIKPCDDLLLEGFLGMNGGVTEKGKTFLYTPYLQVVSYPNPATQKITLSYTLQEEDNIQIVLQGLDHNNFGQTFTILELTEQKAGKHQTTIQVVDIPPGTYLLSLQTKITLYQNRILIK